MATPNSKTSPALEAVNQGSHLPSGNLTLTSIAALTSKNWEDWLDKVQTVLFLNGLEDLINESLIHPAQNDRNYALWLKLTKNVNGWMRLSLSPEILKELRAKSERPETPDKLMSVLREIVTSAGQKRRHNAWMDAILINRNDFNSVKDFVTEARCRITYSNRVNMPITPDQAACINLRNVEAEMESYVTSKLMQLEGVLGTKSLTEAQFLRICNQVVDFAEERTAIRAFSTSGRGNKQVEALIQ